MPWKESSCMDERMIFVSRWKQGEFIIDLCKEFGISRKTGHKFINRYKKFGPNGLYNQSRRPYSSPHATPVEIRDLIVETKKEKSTWGAAKIREWLLRRHSGVQIPSRFTVHEILNKYDLVQHRKPRRKGKTFSHSTLTQSQYPNDIWCADYKGQFKLGNGKYCYPLTISDHESRYLISCEGLENNRENTAFQVFEEAFEENGLPEYMRTDNGVPFSSNALFGLSKLSVWWMKLGIKLQRIEPGKPQQNGRHERMHLTLKIDTTRPAARNFLQQQEKFDQFKNLYNNDRPHEALNMKCPTEFYKPSKRKYPQTLTEPDYPLHDESKYVGATGKLKIAKNIEFHLTEALSEQKVGIREEDIGLWRITFMNLDLGLFDAHERKFRPFQQPQSPRVEISVLPMSPGRFVTYVPVDTPSEITCGAIIGEKFL